MLFPVAAIFLLLMFFELWQGIIENFINYYNTLSEDGKNCFISGFLIGLTIGGLLIAPMAAAISALTALGVGTAVAAALIGILTRASHPIDCASGYYE